MNKITMEENAVLFEVNTCSFSEALWVNSIKKDHMKDDRAF